MKLPNFLSKWSRPSQTTIDVAALEAAAGGRAREQHYQFAHRVLPQNAFERPDLALERLSGVDAGAFLHSLWHSVGNDLAPSQRIVPAGLSCEMREFQNYRIALISLPTPLYVPEAFFCALAFDAPRNSGEALELRYLTLEFGFVLENDEKRTVLCEWTAAPAHLNMGDGPPPELEAFFATVCAMLGHAPEPLGGFTPASL
jgi:hypothetical protein